MDEPRRLFLDILSRPNNTSVGALWPPGASRSPLVVSIRRFSPLDHRIAVLGRALATLAGTPVAGRPSPAGNLVDGGPAAGATPRAGLDDAERALSAALMRVNHVGEVCAQALYESQALSARDTGVRDAFRQAAAEEGDHLDWTRRRLYELGGRPSVLNPLWYGGAFAIGSLAGRLGDRFSLGFMAETERQVEQHLAGHLARLPAGDRRSRAIVERMAGDERGHAEGAVARGALPMPAPVRGLMRLAARLMTRTAHHL